MANTPALLSTVPIGEPGKASRIPSVVANSECSSVNVHIKININAHMRVGNGTILIYSELCSGAARTKANGALSESEVGNVAAAARRHELPFQGPFPASR